jgi:quercetin dioxygenase-like cupin family protein
MSTLASRRSRTAADLKDHLHDIQDKGSMGIGRMSPPEPLGAPERTPVQVGEVWENPATRERATILERPWDNPVGRATAELTALVGARVAGEHYHPALVEKFTVLEGELTVKREGQTSILHQGETAVIEPGIWHDWWNAGDRDARVRVEATPGERFLHMIETFFGLARLGSTDGKGMPSPLQAALTAREFSDVIVFRSPPLVVQRAIFGALAPIARWRGYRATYPQLSRIVLAPRTQRQPLEQRAVMADLIRPTNCE